MPAPKLFDILVVNEIRLDWDLQVAVPPVNLFSLFLFSVCFVLFTPLLCQLSFCPENLYHVVVFAGHSAQTTGLEECTFPVVLVSVSTYLRVGVPEDPRHSNPLFASCESAA